MILEEIVHRVENRLLELGRSLLDRKPRERAAPAEAPRQKSAPPAKGAGREKGAARREGPPPAPASRAALEADLAQRQAELDETRAEQQQVQERLAGNQAEAAL